MMAHMTLTSAMREATPEACRKLVAQGINFAVAIEQGNAEWVLAHAESIANAHDIANAYVSWMDARGCSIWRMHEDGLAERHCGLITPDHYWEDVDGA